MKVQPLIFLSTLLSMLSHGQEPIVMQVESNRGLFLHYYPTALVAGEVSTGLEYLFKNKFSHELSLSIRFRHPSSNNYDEGFRTDYLLKYRVYTFKSFHFAPCLSFEYKNIYFDDKPIYYEMSDGKGTSAGPYQILLENGSYVEYGGGVAFSLGFKLYKRLLLGGDLCMNMVKYQKTNNYLEVMYRDPTEHPDVFTPEVPSTSFKENTSPSLSPMARLKATFFIGKS